MRVDDCASVFVDLAVSKSARLPPVLHLSHPHSASWDEIMATLAELASSHLKKEVTVVPYPQ